MPPNIVLFMTDQLRRDALGCYGNEICRTPNLDKLAQEGTRFDQAYAVSPVCSPSRASLMSGRYPHNHGVMINTHIAPTWNRGLPADSPTFSRQLKDAGYVLDYAGKWHVNEDLGPEDFGFDRHGLSGNARRSVNMRKRVDPMKLYEPGTESVIEFERGRMVVAGTSTGTVSEHPTSQVTDQGIQMLRERATGDDPFFLRIDVVAPHFANRVPEPYASMYDPASIPPWPNFDETFEDKPAGHLRKHQEWHLEDKDWAWWQQVIAKYYGDVTLIDDCVGRVLDAIRECGIEDGTIVVFSTDHGDAAGSHKHFEKSGTMYDEVFRIPMLAKVPGQDARVVPEFVRLMDLMPTFVEWGDAKMPHDLDGRSLAPLIYDDVPADWPDSVYCESHGEVWGYSSQRMVRTDRWKYVYCPHDLDELYDLDADPAEMSNLINDPAHRDILQQMKARLIGWNDATGDMFQWMWVQWNFPEPVSPYPGPSS
ncbi:MAG: sulfatase [OM182 bacterium MED-G24]|uniref:Sulfatase n=1 Tax=OM182 bacterium MED-G24 TaxID=1986255 RepID=A0A2A5WML7_9GAMM|nr:MAG: sulfatase [OM182 bacterium MED-G24]